MAIILFLLFQVGGGGLFSLLPILLMVAVFYFLIIRPQQKKAADLAAMLETLKSGERVVTSGGIIGVIAQVKPGSYILRSGDKAMLEVTRTAIAGRYEGGEDK